jgi:hypothetical protein
MPARMRLLLRGPESALAQRRYAQHDPASEFLFPPLNLPDNESGPDEPFQIVLFE